MKAQKLSDVELKAFKAKLSKAFKELRKQGYFARQDFKCCTTCALHAVPDGKNYVFYHAQNTDELDKGDVWLTWDGNGGDIIQALEKAGLQTFWDGSIYRKIKATYVSKTLDK